MCMQMGHVVSMETSSTMFSMCYYLTIQMHHIWTDKGHFQGGITSVYYPLFPMLLVHV